MTDDETTGTRLQSVIKTEDYQFVQGLRLKTGTITTTVNILWAKLVKTLKEHGIVDIKNREEFEDFVTNCKLTLNNEEHGHKTKTNKRRIS